MKNKHKHTESPYSLSGKHNTLNQGSFSNLEMETIMYFRALPFERKVEALRYLIELSNRERN